MIAIATAISLVLAGANVLSFYLAYRCGKTPTSYMAAAILTCISLFIDLGVLNLIGIPSGDSLLLVFLPTLLGFTGLLLMVNFKTNQPQNP